jgi:hypothetical protein
VMADANRSDGRSGSRAHWENWSRNGRVCITGLVPPSPAGTRLASWLTWEFHSFASRCRRTHDATGAFAFAATGPRAMSVLVWAMSLSFDLPLAHPSLIRARVRRRGGDPDACRWPRSWLEGGVYDYLVHGDPPPPGRTWRRKILVLAEEHQAFVPTKAASLAGGIRRGWERRLDVLAAVDGAVVTGLLDEDERAFLANLLVLIHVQPGTAVRPNPAAEDSVRRHEQLVAELAPAAEAKGLPVSWHALWRLPPAMAWSSKPGGRTWMRYPAVSFLAAARPLLSAE